MKLFLCVGLIAATFTSIDVHASECVETYVLDGQVLYRGDSIRPHECNYYQYPGFTAYSEKNGSIVSYKAKNPEIFALQNDDLKKYEWMNLSFLPDKKLWVKSSDMYFMMTSRK